MLENLHKAAIERDGSTYGNVKKVFLSYPCRYFDDAPDLQFAIFNKISTEFKIPFSSIRVTGSAHLGYSFVKQRPFTDGESDLDISLVDCQLFQTYLEAAYESSNGFEPTAFPNDKDGKPTRSQFVSNSARGIIRPDLMPNCPARQKLYGFFNRLSAEFSKQFKSINAGIYISETIFVLKQRSSLIDAEAGAK